jgi:hypothetical protein
VRQRPAEIPTLLRITPKWDRQLLTAPAAKVMAQSRQDILEFLDGSASAALP